VQEHPSGRGDGGMTRRGFLGAGLAASAALATGPVRAAPAVHAGKHGPNVLVVMTDQQHLETISARGCAHVATPGLDGLCRRGTTFRCAYSGHPLCSPGRSSLWTGRMPSETGVVQNGRPIHKSIPNVGQWFRDRTNYETVYVGKWHLPRSFTHNVPGFTTLTPGVNGQGNLGDTSTALACEGYLRNRSSGRPFLMVASFFQPHDICQWLRLNQSVPSEGRYPSLADALPPLPANFAANEAEAGALCRQRDGDEPGATKGRWTPDHWRYYRWSYYRHIEMVDAEIGRLLAALDATGRTGDTLVVFTSDHGEGLAHHQMVRKNFLYDEAARVPLIVSLPGEVPADGDDVRSLVSGVDVVPTVCDYVGIAPPPQQRGRSLRPVLEGKARQAAPFVVSEVTSRGTLARMVRSDRYKYITYKGDPVEQVFDMQTDPGETRNLAGASEAASVLEDHRRMLAEWEQRLIPAPGLPPKERWRSA